MTYKRAVEVYDTGWWYDVHPKDALIRQLRCNRVIMPFDTFQHYAIRFFPGVTQHQLATCREELAVALEEQKVLQKVLA